MAGALYRKYRSSNFSEIIGQDHITTTLQNSIDSKTFSHAYLLTGLRGVGKTSIARIFAYEINNIKPKSGEVFPDIIEIDAASNRKIDEIRDLREKVIVAPTSLDYKVYIIDEVHMLTREAFNALLKTLEEPPAHCVFILATTDYHKLPDTITSRCIRFALKSIEPAQISKHLTMIASKENIGIDADAIREIAANSSNSLRDAITILDQARNLTDKIKTSHVEIMLGIANERKISQLLEAIEQKNPRLVQDQLQEIYKAGAITEQVIKQFTQLLRQKIIDGEPSQKNKWLDMIRELMIISQYDDDKLAFEVCLLKQSLGGEEHQASNLQADNSSLDPEHIELEKKQANSPRPKAAKPTEAKTNHIDHPDLWQKVLGDLKQTNYTLYGIARMADTTVAGSEIELNLKFPFHKKQLDLQKNKKILLEILSKHNSDIKSIIVVINTENQPEVKKINSDSEQIKNVSNIFGSAEVLES